MIIKNTNVLLENREILTDVDIHIKENIIDYIGKSGTLIINDNDIFDGKDKLVMPGFVNTHCHVPMTLLRNLGQGLPLDKWLREKIFPIETLLTDEYVYYGSLLGIAEMIKSGITSFSDMYYFSDKICETALTSGINANIALDGFAFDNNLKSKFAITEGYLQDFYKNFNGMNNNQIKIDMCIHAQYTTTPEKSKKLGNIAKDLGANIQLHLSETEKENLDCIKAFGKTPTQYFNDLGIFDNPTTAAHCVYLNDTDIDILNKKSVSMSYCPVSNLKLGSGIVNLAPILNAGINITLGTDGAASNDNLDFFSNLKTGILLQKGINKDATFLSPLDIIKIATANGALSQNRKNTGTIAVGSKADLFVIDLNQINLQPSNDLIDGVVFSALSENIVLTMANGKVLYENGIFKTIDIEKVISSVKTINKNLY